MYNEHARMLANELHNSGLSDSEIAKLTGVTRSYINTIRNGKSQASQELEARLQELCNRETPLQPQEHSIPLENETEESPNEAGETGNFPWGAILAGTAIIILIAIALLVIPRIRHKK